MTQGKIPELIIKNRIENEVNFKKDGLLTVQDLNIRRGKASV